MRKPRTRKRPCSRRTGRTSWPSTSNGRPGAILSNRSWGTPPARDARGLLVEGVIEHPADRGLGLLLAIHRDRPAEGLGEQPGVVQAEQVVGVVMGVEDRVDLADPLAEQLEPHLGRGVDQQVAGGQLDRTLGRIPRLRGSSDRQTSHSHPITGTPVEVPVPRKISRRPPPIVALRTRPLARSPSGTPDGTCIVRPRSPPVRPRGSGWTGRRGPLQSAASRPRDAHNRTEPNP